VNILEGKMKRAKIVNKLSKRVGLTKSEVSKLFGCLLGLMVDELYNKERVRLPYIGIFELKQIKKYINPRIKEDIYTELTPKIKFKPSARLLIMVRE